MTVAVTETEAVTETAPVAVAESVSEAVAASESVSDQLDAGGARYAYADRARTGCLASNIVRREQSCVPAHRSHRASTGFTRLPGSPPIALQPASSGCLTSFGAPHV